MSNDGGHCEVVVISRLCRLIDDSIPNFTDSEVGTLSEDEERQFLISLSKVWNQIRSWTTELDIDSLGSVSCSKNFDSNSAEQQCLISFVVELIFLLNVKSQYVQHLVGNIFVAISELLVVHDEHNWIIFIGTLCDCFEFALCNICGHRIQPSMTGAESSNHTQWNLSFIKTRLKNSTWNCMAGIIGILRGMTKLLKGEDHEELVGVLLNSLNDFLVRVPWDFFDRNQNGGSKVCKSLSEERALLSMNDGESDVKILFLGHLVQLLCSLVGLTGSLEAGPSSQSKCVILDNVHDLVPRLLHWCLGKECSYNQKVIRPYFQHKILMLMIRLSFNMQLDSVKLVQWLQFLRHYCQDLLSRPMYQLEYNQDDSLEDSPFLLSLFVEESQHLSLHHLQRQAIFLFMRCSLTLIDMRLSKSTAHLDCYCTSPRSSFASDLNGIRDCCVEGKGLFEFYQWLQGHIPPNMLTEDGIYQEKCIEFASSFVKLYKNEDDMLFEVLLQMLTIPLSLSIKEMMACQDVEDDILFLLSNLFNPLLLFHVFLAELQYDHQLLLDYLISKDTGSKCAEYLLNCLRIVCDSWKLFVELPVRGCVWQKRSEHSRKRKKSFHGDSCADRSAETVNSGLALSSEHNQKEQELESKLCARRRLKFEDAKACLLSLKSSLRKLHKRKLFPYNPEALVRRLTRFEELCNQQV